MPTVNNNEIDCTVKPRKEERDAANSGIIHPKRSGTGLFGGWGPRLLSVALAAAALGASNTATFAAPRDFTSPSCSTADREATVTNTWPPDVPALAQAEGASGEALIRVDLSETGELQNAEIVKSTGNAALDREAMRVAHESTYSPASVGCEGIPSSYLFSVNFTS